MDVIDSHPDKPWEYFRLSQNPNVTVECIKSRPRKRWFWEGISLTLEDVDSRPMWPWPWWDISYNEFDKHPHYKSPSRKSRNRKNCTIVSTCHPTRTINRYSRRGVSVFAKVGANVRRPVAFHMTFFSEQDVKRSIQMSTIVPAVFSDSPKGINDYSLTPPASLRSQAPAVRQTDIRPLTTTEIDQLVAGIATGMRGIAVPDTSVPYMITKWRFWVTRTNDKIKATYGKQDIGHGQDGRKPMAANEIGETLSPTSYFLAHVNVNDVRLQAVEASTAPLGPLLPMDLNTMSSALDRSGDFQAPFFRSWIQGANALSRLIKGSNPTKTIVPMGNIYVRGPVMLPEMRLQTSEPLYGNIIENFGGGVTTNEIFLGLAIVFIGYLATRK